MAIANRLFQVADPAVLHALVRAQPLATLVVSHEGTMHVNHVPLYLDPTHGTLVGHLGRSNGVLPLLPQTAVAVFHGPQAYVSPSWYLSKAVDGKGVPTWNYATVHARGSLRTVDDSVRLREILNMLTDAHEAYRPQPWRVEDSPPDYLDTMLRAIVGIELVVERWEGIWKVSQNRSAADRAGVVRGLLAEGTAQARAMVELMQ